jgi:hypothetical protein
MTPERWRQIDDLFDAALRVDPAEREAWLGGRARTCIAVGAARKHVPAVDRSLRRRRSGLRRGRLCAALYISIRPVFDTGCVS